MSIFKSSLLDRDLPIDLNKYLLNFLNPTQDGSKYYHPPSKTNIAGLTVREINRIVKQVFEIHQILEKNFGIDQNLRFLDVGTGNGMVPKLLCEVRGNVYAHAIDPFLHGGHTTSWQKSDLVADLEKCKQNWFSNFEEHGSQKTNSFYFEQKCYLNELLSEKDFICFDVVYSKAIEHVPDWLDFAKDLTKTLNKGGLLIIKHRSFFSYLGPHRYASTAVPWGHCLLSDDDYKRYVCEFHSDRKEQMLDFYFKDLSYPRMKMFELDKIMNSFGLNRIFYEVSEPRYQKLQEEVIAQNPWLIEAALSCNSNLTKEELTSGLITTIYKKDL